jgi:sugar (pentulose or hexulose) kinase
MIRIGLDIGTSSCKAPVIDGRTVRTSARRAYPPQREKPGWAGDPGSVWRVVLAVPAKIAPQARNADAMAISSLGESFVLLNERDSR